MTEAAATFWNARTILTRLCDADTRRKVAISFWKQGDAHARALALAHMAKVMHFRDETLRKAPVEKKGEWLLSRVGAPELNDCFEMGLMIYHTDEKGALMGDLLDRWGIPHVNGTIEVEEYVAPTREKVEAAVNELSDKYSKRDLATYLATAGLLMGNSEKEWREAMWPVADRLAAEIGDAA